MKLRQIEDVKITRHKSTESLVIRYREAGHLNIETLSVIDDVDTGKYLLKKAILAWLAVKAPVGSLSKEAEDKAEEEGWELKLREVYRYRHWLPRDVIDSIPTFPCTLEERMSFLEKLKPYEGRMGVRDSLSRILLSLFGAANIGTALYAGGMIIWKQMIQAGDVNLAMLPLLGCMLVSTAIYITFLKSWWKKRDSALIANGIYSFFFIGFMFLPPSPWML